MVFMSQLFSVLHCVAKPRLLVPQVRVQSIREIDFTALKRAGYRGAVFDKDNCLTVPNKDKLVPQLQFAWQDCRRTFGEGNVVIVSNSAGTRNDPAGIEAESVSHHLGVPVLSHNEKKPSCSKTIIHYFSPAPSSFSHNGTPIALRSIKPSELIVVGDRVFTDVLMGNKLGSLTILTEGLWEKELMPMRYVEKSILWTLGKLRNRSKGTVDKSTNPQSLFVLQNIDPELIVLSPWAHRWATTKRIALVSYRTVSTIFRTLRNLIKRVSSQKATGSAFEPKNSFRTVAERYLARYQNTVRESLRKTLKLRDFAPLMRYIQSFWDRVRSVVTTSRS